MYTWMKQNDENTENAWNNLFILYIVTTVFQSTLGFIRLGGRGIFFYLLFCFWYLYEKKCNVSCQIHYTFFVRKPNNIEYVARKMLKIVVQFLKSGMFFLGCTQLL